MIATAAHETTHINQMSSKDDREKARKEGKKTAEEKLAEHTENELKNKLDIGDEEYTPEEMDDYLAELREDNKKNGREQKTLEQGTEDAKNVKKENEANSTIHPSDMDKYVMPMLQEIVKENPEFFKDGQKDVNTMLDTVPIVGDVKGVVEGIIGKNLLGEELSTTERLLGLIALSELKSAGKIGKYTDEMLDFMKESYKKFPDLFKKAVKNDNQIKVALEGIENSGDVVKVIDDKVDDVVNKIDDIGGAKKLDNTGISKTSGGSNYNFKKLSNTEDFSKNGLEHVLEGEINKKGRAGKSNSAAQRKQTIPRVRRGKSFRSCKCV